MINSHYTHHPYSAFIKILQCLLQLSLSLPFQNVFSGCNIACLWMKLEQPLEYSAHFYAVDSSAVANNFSKSQYRK